MTQKHSPLQSSLSRAKGHGAAHEGVSHWWVQRVTAVALVPLLVWFVVSLLVSMTSSDVTLVAAWFASPVNTLGMVALLVAVFWHAKLGLQVVIEDYIKCPCMKYSLLLANTFVAYGCVIAGVLAVLRMHMIDLSSFGA